MNQIKYYILLHGPYIDNSYNEIFNSLKKVKKNILEVIICSYIADMEKTDIELKKYSNEFNIKRIYVKDVVNPGFANINRQIITVRNGLENIEDENPIVVKIRNDQWCDMSKLNKYLNKFYFDYVSENCEKILSINCFTRKDRLYHPSDMFLCGYKKNLLEYYSMPLQKNTDMDYKLYMIKKIRNSNEEFKTYQISPESELFKHYLKLKNWNFKMTQGDSYDALYKYINLINTWDINLRWNKQRNAFLPAKTIILPYSFTIEPFPGVHKEETVCYARHHFDGNYTLRDRYFILYSRIVYSIKYNKIHRILLKIKNRLPRKVKNILKKTYIGKKIKKIFN